MSSEERARAALIRAAAESWGQEVAATLSELLPPDGDRPATRRDIEGVLAAMNAMDERHEARFDALEGRSSRLEARVDGLEARFDGLEARFDGFEERVTLRLDAAVDRITAVFERRISEAITTQTRTLVFSQLGALVVISALAFGLQ